MKVAGVFLIGLALGIVLGMGGSQILPDETLPAPPADQAEEVSHEACRVREETLRAEVEVLRARAGGEVAEAPDAAATAAEPAEDPFRAAVKVVRAKLGSVVDAEPGSDEVQALIREWRAVLDTEDERMGRLATWALKRLVADGKFRPADVEGFVAEFRALPAGARARPGLAGVVTRAFAEDERLAAWFGDLPRTDEPKVREQAVWALDESPSAAFRDYILKLSREETNAEVLRSVWNEDIILVTLTRETAPKLIDAVRDRVARGDLPPVVRARAYFAIGLAATHSPDLAKSAIEAMLASETDAGVTAFAADVGKAVEREESNVQALEGLWDRHAERFGE